MAKSVSILLVDDEAKNLVALESILESHEYRLVKAQTADEAEGGVAAVDVVRRIGAVSPRCLPWSSLSPACTQLPMAAEISQSAGDERL